MSLPIKPPMATALLSLEMLAPLLGQSPQVSLPLHILLLQVAVAVRAVRQVNMVAVVVVLVVFSLEH
jgi:hypothetical protein